MNGKQAATIALGQNVPVIQRRVRNNSTALRRE